MKKDEVTVRITDLIKDTDGKLLSISSRLVQFVDIKEGDIFTLYRPDGSIIFDDDNYMYFRATSDPYDVELKNNIHTMQIDEEPLTEILKVGEQI